MMIWRGLESFPWARNGSCVAACLMSLSRKQATLGSFPSPICFPGTSYNLQACRSGNFEVQKLVANYCRHLLTHRRGTQNHLDWCQPRAPLAEDVLLEMSKWCLSYVRNHQLEEHCPKLVSKRRKHWPTSRRPTSRRPFVDRRDTVPLIYWLPGSHEKRNWSKKTNASLI